MRLLLCTQVVSGLRKHVPLDQMKSRRVVVCTNLKPAKMRDVMSYGMVRQICCLSSNSFSSSGKLYIGAILGLHQQPYFDLQSDKHVRFSPFPLGLKAFGFRVCLICCIRQKCTSPVGMVLRFVYFQHLLENDCAMNKAWPEALQESNQDGRQAWNWWNYMEFMTP